MITDRIVVKLPSHHRRLTVGNREEVNRPVIVLQGYPDGLMPNGCDHVESLFGKEPGAESEPLRAVMIACDDDGGDSEAEHQA